jgi:hypothetical protein
MVTFYVIYFIFLARSGQQNVNQTSSFVCLVVRWNLACVIQFHCFFCDESLWPRLLSCTCLYLNVVPVVFSRSVSLILGLYHRNPNQPLWGTWRAGAEQESRHIIMVAGHVRMRYDIASNAKKCSYMPSPLWFFFTSTRFVFYPLLKHSMRAGVLALSAVFVS